MMIRDTAAATSIAYDTIKKRIIENAYPPKSKLAEERLAGELGLGRSPIRSAFARLRSEGWIEISPQSGSYVKALTEQEIKEIFDFRLLLEAHVTRLATQNITDEQLRKLRLAFKRTAMLLDAEFDQATFDEFDELDTIVHLTIYEAAGNALISGVLLNLLEKAQWLKKAISPSTPERMMTWIAELERIIDALESRDAELAVQRVCIHVSHAADADVAFAIGTSKLASSHRP